MNYAVKFVYKPVGKCRYTTLNGNINKTKMSWLNLVPTHLQKCIHVHRILLASSSRELIFRRKFVPIVGVVKCRITAPSNLLTHCPKKYR